MYPREYPRERRLFENCPDSGIILAVASPQRMHVPDFCGSREFSLISPQSSHFKTRASERGLLSIRRAFHDPDLGADSGNSTKPIIASLLRIDGRTETEIL